MLAGPGSGTDLGSGTCLLSLMFFPYKSRLCAQVLFRGVSPQKAEPGESLAPGCVCLLVELLAGAGIRPSWCPRLSSALLRGARLGRSVLCWSHLISAAAVGLLLHKHIPSPGWLNGLPPVSVCLSPSLGRVGG